MAFLQGNSLNELLPFSDNELPPFSDVNVEQPDEKSIITYVVTYYHYFNKVGPFHAEHSFDDFQLKQETIQGKRIGKVIGELMENEALVERYEQLSSGLLEWIKQKIVELNDRQFANSLRGVQQQLSSFNQYRVEEKPPRFQARMAPENN